jgi:hypothetical protein
VTPRKFRPRAQPKPCNWPHVVLEVDEEAELAKALEQYRGWMEWAARVVSDHDVDVANDLMQEARILLWRRGVPWIRGATEQFVREAIVKRMRDVMKPGWRRDPVEWDWEAFDGARQRTRGTEGRGGDYEGNERPDDRIQPLTWRRCA